MYAHMARAPYGHGLEASQESRRPLQLQQGSPSLQLSYEGSAPVASMLGVPGKPASRFRAARTWGARLSGQHVNEDFEPGPCVVR